MNQEGQDSLSLTETASCRYNYWRSRQAERHRLLRQLVSLTTCSSTDQKHAQGNFDHFKFDDLDEATCRKRIILPVVSRLRAPTLSRRLRNRIKSLLRKQGVPSCSTLNLLAPKSVALTPVTTNDAGERIEDDAGRDSCCRLEEPFITTADKAHKSDDEFAIPSYTGSATFLKGTQSANPHNDYCQHFVDTGERPQNFIRDTGLRNRFEEYPKLRELIRLKDELIQSKATPPMYLRADLKTFDLNELESKFDVVLIEPPLEEYHRMNGAVFDQHWTWEEIERLEIEQIIAPRAFVWIWCGSGEGLDAARKCLRKWGFRRCEDICWIKTNHGQPGHQALEPGAVFQRTKEHCLMGIHGTVRRSTDGDFIHANIDIDLIIEEAPKYGGYAAKDKPTEILHIIEHFCLGRRRLHLFGRDSTLRAGWLTVGNELSASNFDARLYASNFSKEPNGWQLGTTEDIERLRPKSPPPRHPNVVGSSNVSSNPTGPKPQGSVNAVFTPGPIQSTHTRLLLEPTTLSTVNKPAVYGLTGRRSGIQVGSKLGEPHGQQPSLLGLPSPITLGTVPLDARSVVSEFTSVLCRYRI
ncbi:hypothetical protein P879_09071 [Paragonimus westermani]|uniref:N(6)-adenosine-methyltransferase non-catalytic subunit METTL14 n=1 Tax=Paragonimus westermani TaxID=34504 RepID=A0A8T0D7W4_9TREM|nr:hypothetical protein P879_09071 [Paragonimus westermani]